MPKTTEELYQELLEQGRQQQQQAQDYLNAYDNRGQFSYDAANDPLYQSLKNQYVHQGRRAMEDTMGQSAWLTGGYGSSYSQSVGNQAYNEYLTQLNAQIPGLAQQARANWDAEGNRLLDRYNLALNAANTAYGQARDALGDLRYDQEYNDNRAYQQWQMDRANQGDAYDRAMMLIQMGRMPDEASLQAAGLNAADAKWMADYYAKMLAQQQAGSGRSSGGGGGGGGYGYQPTPGTDESTNPMQTSNPLFDVISNAVQTVQGGTADALNYMEPRIALTAAARNGNIDEAYRILDQMDGQISDAEMQELIKYFEKLFGTKWGSNKPSHGPGGTWKAETQ